MTRSGSSPGGTEGGVFTWNEDHGDFWVMDVGRSEWPNSRAGAQGDWLLLFAFRFLSGSLTQCEQQIPAPMNHAQDPDCFGAGVVEQAVPADPQLTHV